MTDVHGDLILEPFGLSGMEERCYRLLLEHPGQRPSDIAVSLSLSGVETRKALKGLEGKGLVSRKLDKDRGYVASPPDLALEVLFVQRRRELERAHELSKTLIKKVAEPAHLGEAITVAEGPEAFNEQCNQLQTTVFQEMKWFDKALRKDRSTSLSFNSEQVERMAQGISYRTIYESSTWDEAYLQAITQYVAAGEQARVVERLPMKMLIADQQVALISLHQRDDDSVTGTAIVRSPAVIEALCELFEATWARALPFLPQESPSSAELKGTDRQILALMVGGAKDESIARHLGLDPSTVRRRIKSMMKSLGATTRFQAGLQAGKKGWL